MHLIIAYTTLMATLVYAAWLDHKFRRIPHRTWIPLLIITAIPLFSIWQELGWEVWAVTVLCMSIYFMPIIFAESAVFSIHGADAIAAILITLIKPMTLGYPTPIFFVLITGSLILIVPCVPCIKKSWEKQGIPFLVPLTVAAAIILTLPQC